MERQTIDGHVYARMLIGGAAALSAHTAEINDLNVFPVADGDTGTNMSKTMEGGLAEIFKMDISSIAVLSERFAKGILLSARGNSGVILSQIFAGIGEGLADYETVSAKELAAAYQKGIRKAYAAVQNPTEGTILTVFRESVDYAASQIEDASTVEDFFRIHIEEARRSLERTKELLPVLAEADVIDSGGAGYFYIAEGMYHALTGKTNAVSYVPTAQTEAAVNIDRFTRDSVLEFGYCTEFLLRLTTAKGDPESFATEPFVATLKALGGESIVAYKQDDMVKVHVHTFTPSDVLAAAQKYGEFLTVKIENMSLGHTENGKEKNEKKKERKRFSVLAVTQGEGMSALFSTLGADVILSGGQTANPSIEEFIRGFENCDAENIIVLPNNKNVFLAAKQASELYKDARVYVVETKTMMQGYSALSVITPGLTDMEALVASATRAAQGVIGCEVTQAVREATVEGRRIHKGDYLAITDGEITATAENAEEAVKAALANRDADLFEIITLFVGKNVRDEQRAALTEELKALYPDCEITVFLGGQDIYDYWIAIE